MPLDQLKAKIAAQKSYTSLLEQAAACAELYDKSQLPYPEELRALFGYVQGTSSSNGNGHGKPTQARNGAANVSERPYRVPDGIDADWVGIPMAETLPTSLVVAHLKEAGTSVPVRNLLDVVSLTHPGVSKGTIANIGTRLAKNGIIERNDGGWNLLKPELAGIVMGDRLWGPAAIIDKYELAAVRREAIVHLLKHFKSGLQIVQMVERLRDLTWVKAPVNKDLLKGDMKILEKAKVAKHSGNSKKWVLVAGGSMTERAAD